MEEYKKPRVAIGAFGSSDVLCRCITELVGKNPTALALYVLTPGEKEKTELRKICAMRLSAPVRKRVLLIAAGRQQPGGSGRQDNDQGPAERLLEPETVSNFARWLDQRSARQLRETLETGEHLLFVQISNASQEIHAFDRLSHHCNGAVRLHDLPVH